MRLFVKMFRESININIFTKREKQKSMEDVSR